MFSVVPVCDSVCLSTLWRGISYRVTTLTPPPPQHTRIPPGPDLSLPHHTRKPGPSPGSPPKPYRDPWTCLNLCNLDPVADPGGPRGPCPLPGPVKISHKKDGCQRQLHRFHVSHPPPYLTAGSATVDLTVQTRLPSPQIQRILPFRHLEICSIWTSLYTLQIKRGAW